MKRMRIIYVSYGPALSW